MEFALQTENLTKVYPGDKLAVEDVSLRLRPGEFLTMLGPSGGGKTTTLRLLAGFERPTSGSIEVGAQIVADDERFTPPEHRRVGMVFQDYALFPHLDVKRNIAFGLRNGKRDRQAQVKRMLDLVDLADCADRMPHELSGGQQQRVALARALAPNPDILLLDEPFSNLDSHLRAQVRSQVRSILLETGTAAVFVTHDQQEALGLADEIAVIFEGRLLQVATPHIIYNRPVNSQVAHFIGDANFLWGEAHGWTASSPLGEIKLFHARTGRVQLMIRPEALQVSLAEEGMPGAVEWREFHGHFQRLGLRLQNGAEVIANAGVDRFLKRGDKVWVAAALPALAFDANGDAGLGEPRSADASIKSS